MDFVRTCYVRQGLARAGHNLLVPLLAICFSFFLPVNTEDRQIVATFFVLGLSSLFKSAMKYFVTGSVETSFSKKIYVGIDILTFLVWLPLGKICFLHLQCLALSWASQFLVEHELFRRFEPCNVLMIISAIFFVEAACSKQENLDETAFVDKIPIASAWISHFAKYLFPGEGSPFIDLGAGIIVLGLVFLFHMMEGTNAGGGNPPET